jgi:hypothetical protein
METIVDRSTLEVLRAGLRGTAYAPGEEGYDEARKAWNLNAHQAPRTRGHGRRRGGCHRRGAPGTR